MNRYSSIILIALCALSAFVTSSLAQQTDAPTQAPNQQQALPVSPNSNQQQQQQQQPHIPNQNQGMQGLIPQQMQGLIPNQWQQGMQNLYPNGQQQMPYQQQMPFDNNGMQQQMNPNQMGNALTNMLQRGMSLLQAVRQLMSSIRNPQGQMMPNMNQMIPNSNFQMPNGGQQFGGNMIPRMNGGGLNGMTGPLDGILGQTGLPIQLSSVTNPLSQTLNGLLNPTGLRV